MEYNIYCDESCYLQNPDGNYMVLGALYCPKNKVREIKENIKELKKKYKIGNKSELKWTNVTKNKEDFYIELINYFFIEDDLLFRGIICDKTILDHKKHHQTHDEWYHKMYYDMLKYILFSANTYNIYGDVKDNHSYEHFQKTLEFLRKEIVDEDGKTLKKMQPILSEESLILQLADIIIGAICYYYRKLDGNSTKLKIIEIINKKTFFGLDKNTTFKNRKFNILVWNPNCGKQ